MARDMDTTGRHTRLAKLKRRVARGEYTPDAGAVADELLEKLRLVSAVRTQLTAGAITERGLRAVPRSRQRFEARPRHQDAPAAVRHAA
jgi:hypothetical protein